jgi:site-specific recombinase XerD
VRRKAELEEKARQRQFQLEREERERLRQLEQARIDRLLDEAESLRRATNRLTCRSVANIVKAYAGRAGFDASTFSGHSLRSGFLTSAAGNGASIFKMMDVSRRKSVDTLRGYVRDAELFKDHAGAGLL